MQISFTKSKLWFIEAHFFLHLLISIHLLSYKLGILTNYWFYIKISVRSSILKKKKSIPFRSEIFLNYEKPKYILWFYYKFGSHYVKIHVVFFNFYDSYIFIW